MEAKIKVASVKQYTATDGRTFTGQGAQQKALDHQEKLDTAVKIKAVHATLVNHLHDILSIDLPPKEPSDKNDYEAVEEWEELIEDYDDNCYEVLKDIVTADLESMDDLASIVSSLFFLIGKEKWNSIADLLDKKRW
jgi:hypothetical protein